MCLTVHGPVHYTVLQSWIYWIVYLSVELYIRSVKYLTWIFRTHFAHLTDIFAQNKEQPREDPNEQLSINELTWTQ